MLKKFLLMLCFIAAITLNAQVRNDAGPIRSEQFIQQFGGLNNFFLQLRLTKQVNVAFLGGSITRNPGWRDKVGEYLKNCYPDVRFNFINAGIPSLGSVPHAFRVWEDVFKKGRIDLMFIEAAVNDRGNGTPEIQQIRSLEGIVRQAFSTNPYINLVLMAFADERKIEDYNGRLIPVEVKVHQEIAREYKVPFINFAAEVTERIRAGEFSWKEDFKDLHPSPFGQEVYFSSIKRLFQLQAENKPAPTKLKKAKVPRALDQYNYKKGRYAPIKKAILKSGFSFIDEWKPEDGVRARPGFYSRPILEGTQAGAELDFEFKGSTIGLAVNSGPDAGTIEYSIDGGKPVTVDLFTPWSKSLHLPWYLILGDELKKSRHTINIKILGNRNTASKGNACRIVYFLVN
ncbi:SGNH/GDSL hydrolase family protein [Desertivirga arenae]|uniref:SGNH/GDSL hydrolase family protein n=1 Tax=Desertivirga arenae TaxID=2810309 RepID=UPI001A969BFC|nr:SGNH/GDSL hydrolase family protein [Pedobacter sp. SYSU D00823]